MINKSRLKKIYFELLKIRTIEETISKKYSDQEMRCPIHLSIGQEAIAVGISQNLKDSDQIVSNHRCHAHYLAKGGDVKNMINEFYGNSFGCSGGRAGSMHLFDKRKGILSSVPIVSSAIPLGVGAGFSMKYNDNNNIAVIFIGDAAIEEGVFYESLNYAKILSLPVLFICENNFFSCFTNINERQPVNLINKISKSFNIKTHYIDGNDVIKITEESEKIINKIRIQKEPHFVILNTYRLLEHCGPNHDDNLNYRNPKQIIYWKKKCPIKKLEKILISKKIFNKSQINELKSNYEKNINHLFESCRKKKFLGKSLKEIKIYA